MYTHIYLKIYIVRERKKRERERGAEQIVQETVIKIGVAKTTL